MNFSQAMSTLLTVSLLSSNVWGLEIPVKDLSPKPLAGKAGSGGGNMINGRAVENYRVRNPEKLAAYENVVLPALVMLREKAPEFEQNLEDNLYNLAWYRVPGPLDKLDFLTNGLPFASEQGAIQTSGGEVWLDENSFPENTNKEGLKSQGTVIVHELIMAEIFKETKSPGEIEHARVRKLTDSIFDETLTSDGMKVAIEQNGFSSSVQHVTPFYTVVEPVPNKSGQAAIIIRKGPQFMIKLCSSDAMTDMHQKAEEFNTPQFPHLQAVLATASHNPGCQVVGSSVYVVTKENMNAFDQAISNTSGNIAIGGIGILIASILAGLARFRGLGTVGALSTVGTFGYALHYGNADHEDITAMKISVDSNELLRIEEPADKFAARVGHTLDKLTDKGYARRIQVK